MARSARPRRRRDHVAVRVALALAVSLAANALLLWIAFVTGAFDLGRPVKLSPVSLAPLSAEDWARNRQVVPPPRPVPPPAMPLPDRNAGKVVEVPAEPPPGATNERPDDARFLAERNQRVDRETVSRFAQGHAGPVLPVPQPGSPGKVAPKPQPAPGRQVARAESPKGEAGVKAGEGGAPRAAGEPDGGERKVQGARDGARAQRAGEKPDLSISPEILARIGGGPNMDGFGDAEEGEVTALNTREFKYATYMNQIRRRIGEQWYPKVHEVVQARDPEGKAFFYKERAVTLAVTLDTGGRVSDIRVLESSNVDFFDRLAISSVRQAQPFLNPPPGLFDRDGYARIPFGFVLYPSERSGSLFWRPPTDR